MTFEQDMNRFVAKVYSLEEQLFRNTVAHAKLSITYGSPVTGAPGQPVDKEKLRPSYKIRSNQSRVARIVSDSPYAEIIEDNRRGATLRSKVGGFHSIKLTRIGWRRIVAYELKKLKMTGGSVGMSVGSRGRNARGQFTGNTANVTISG